MALIGNPIVSTDFPVDYASGNGSTTAFTLSVAPASVNSIDVQISGVSQSPQTYSVSGTTLTFSAAPPSGSSNIVVRHLGVAGIPNTPSAGSVVPSSIGTGYSLWNLSGSNINYTAGNVGIGTASPSEKLTSNNGFLSIGAVSTTARDGALVDYSGNVARFIAGRAGGNYGQWEAHVAGASGVTKRYQIDYDGTTYWYGANGTTERMRIDSSGNLLVGTTNSSLTAGIGIKINYSSTVPYICTTGSDTTNSNGAYYLYSTGASAYRFYVGYGGTISATSATITSLSDQRLKENIIDLPDGLDAVMALKPRKFDWKEGKGKDIKGDRGFIAQEFETVFPDMIEEWKDTPPEGENPYKGVNANLIPTLVKAIQELNAKVEAQALEIKELKGTV